MTMAMIEIRPIVGSKDALNGIINIDIVLGIYFTGFQLNFGKYPNYQNYESKKRNADELFGN